MLDCGVSEEAYWNMTLAEAVRVVESHKRRTRNQQQEKAIYDYILADLIGRSVSRIYSSTSKMPQLYDAYPAIFEEDILREKQAEKQAELSAIRFRKFAQAYEKKHKGGQAD